MDAIRDSFEIGGYFGFECLTPKYELLKKFPRLATAISKRTRRFHDVSWIAPAEEHNLVVNEGLQETLDVMFVSGTQDTTWFIGLTDNSPTPAAGDTLASHAGWTEFDEYTGTRQAYVPVRSSQTITNSASVAAFPITGAGGGVGGGFLTGVTSGTTGILFSVSALSGGNRTVASGDTVNVTYTVTAAAS